MRWECVRQVWPVAVRVVVLGGVVTALRLPSRIENVQCGAMLLAPAGESSPPANGEPRCPTPQDARAEVGRRVDEPAYDAVLADVLDRAVEAWACANPGATAEAMAAWSRDLVPRRPQSFARVEVEVIDADTLVALWQHPDAVGGGQLTLFVRANGSWRRSGALVLDGDRSEIVMVRGARVAVFSETVRTTGHSVGEVSVVLVEAGRIDLRWSRELTGPVIDVHGDTIRIDHLRPPRTFDGGGKFDPKVAEITWLRVSAEELTVRETTPISPLSDLEEYCAAPRRFRRSVPPRVAWLVGSCDFTVTDVAEASYESATIEILRPDCDETDSLTLRRSGDRYLPAAVRAWCTTR